MLYKRLPKTPRFQLEQLPTGKWLLTGDVLYKHPGSVMETQEFSREYSNEPTAGEVLDFVEEYNTKLCQLMN